MSFPPVGSERLCECGACHRGFNSLGAFDAHRQGFRCLEPSSIGMWLATDGLWSLEPRDPAAEATRRRASGLALAARRGQEGPWALGNSHARAEWAPQEGAGPTATPNPVCAGAA